MNDLPLELDYDTSTVILNGRRYPACLMVCPDEEDFPEPNPVQRTLGGDSRYTTNALIPVESGLIVSVDMEKSTGALWCYLWSRTCAHSTQPDGDAYTSMWLPRNLMIHGGQVFEGFQCWDRCEPWWLVEFIDRIASYKYHEPSGPKCDLIRLVELDHSGLSDRSTIVIP
jgi:hypothetical protein